MRLMQRLIALGLCVVLTIIIVQILQEFGMYIARRTDRRART